jgi:hypothetical protein
MGAPADVVNLFDLLMLASFTALIERLSGTRFPERLALLKAVKVFKKNSY